MEWKKGQGCAQKGPTRVNKTGSLSATNPGLPRFAAAARGTFGARGVRNCNRSRTGQIYPVALCAKASRDVPSQPV